MTTDEPTRGWTPDDVVDWLDAFRRMVLEAAEREGGADAYQRLRDRDPLRRLAP